MAMLGRLKPRTYYDLVIEISIVRPGPITGGMVHPYLRRRNGVEEVTYPHECLESVLEKTLGVPLFQEQVMQLAMVAADYTPGEADQLRRDMAAWRRSGRIERHRERLVTRMMRKGIEQEFAERVFQQIRGFGEYGFPESHAASFAHIAYATAYLRCHYPAEFTCALLNAQPMGFYSPATIVNDARIHGVEVRPVSIRHSRWDCTLEEIEAEDAGDSRGSAGSGSKSCARFAVRMGLRYVQRLSKGDWEKLARAMEQAPFRDLPDVVRRSGLHEDKLESLAEAGAFACFGLDRRRALWQVLGAKPRQPPALPLDSRTSPPRFPSLSSLETIVWDHQVSDHSVLGHLLEPLRPGLAARGLPAARELNGMPDGSLIHYVGMVICRQRPGNRPGRYLHDAGGRNGVREPGHLGENIRTVFLAGQDASLLRRDRKPAGGRRSDSPRGRGGLGPETGGRIAAFEEPGFSLDLQLDDLMTCNQPPSKLQSDGTITYN